MDTYYSIIYIYTHTYASIFTNLYMCTVFIQLIPTFGHWTGFHFLLNTLRNGFAILWMSSEYILYASHFSLVFVCFLVNNILGQMVK